MPSVTPRSRPTTYPSPCVVNDTKWSHGNFEIVSSDKISFKCNDYSLFQASPMLASMYAIPVGSTTTGARSIRLVDKKAEKASTIRLFLELVTLDCLPLNVDNCEMGLLLRFLRKWHCNKHRDSLISYLCGELTNGNMGSLQVFIIGAHSNELILCRSAIRAKSPLHSNQWLIEGTTEPFNPACWVTEFWKNGPVPEDYLMSVILAWTETSIKGSSTEGFYSEFAGRLYEIRDPRSHHRKR